MKLIDPFRRLPEGYYRLFLAGWLLVPVLVSLLLYVLVSIWGSNAMNGGGYKSWDAWEASYTWFFILVIAYYPIARISVWVWSGFQKDKGHLLKEKDELIKEVKRIEQKQDTSEESGKEVAKGRNRSITIFVLGGIFSVLLFIGFQKFIVYSRTNNQATQVTEIPVNSDTTSCGLPILKGETSDPFARYGGRAISKEDVKDSTPDYHKLIDLCSMAIKLNSRDWKAFNLRGTSKYNLRDFKGALDDYTKAIEINPKDTQSYYWRGALKFNSQDYQGAIVDYGMVIKLNPNYGEAYYWRGTTEIQINEKDSGCLDLAIARKLGYERAGLALKTFCQ
ncbi:MAG: tetratricopeptide repeat protein [Bacteroidetes bacterium]|nr:tetratricopeptide repeat protein [Bacteroidota bacterium]